MRADILSTPIRDLDLKIEGTWLEPVIAEFQRELATAGLRKVKPHFYLTTEWMVPAYTVAIGIPFYLARADLRALHVGRASHLEGAERAGLLRYLRHEMGHVVNYAYRLYQRPDWEQLFGSIDLPYEDAYTPQAFDRRFVLHLPGWYAQRHPDEDWAETFAVWLTPGFDWRAAYADWPAARAKLDYCDRVLAEVGDREPVVTALELQEEASQLPCTLAEFYWEWNLTDEDLDLPDFDAPLLALFERPGEDSGEATPGPRRPVADLVRKWQCTLVTDVFRWTGHGPEGVRLLLGHLARRADQLRLVYPVEGETQALLGLTAMVTTLARNYVQQGSYHS